MIQDAQAQLTVLDDCINGRGDAADCAAAQAALTQEQAQNTVESSPATSTSSDSGKQSKKANLVPVYVISVILILAIMSVCVGYYMWNQATQKAVKFLHMQESEV